MDLNPVAVFVAIVEAGSFTAAARQLGMPSSTVSAQLSRLEERLGCTLLQRSTRRLRLTDAGEAYFIAARQSLAQLSDAETLLLSRTQQPQGQLRFTTTADLLPPPEMAALLQLFRQQYPKIHVELDMTQRSVDLVHEGVHVAIRAGALPDSQLVARKIGTIQWRLVASPAYVEQAGAPTTPADLLGHKLLQFQGSTRRTWELHSGRRSYPLELPRQLLVNHVDVVIALCMAGEGIALLPSYHCEAGLRAGALIPVLPDWQGPTVPISIVYPMQKYMPHFVRAFVDFAATHFKGYFTP